MRTLICGFEPFNGRDVNNAWEISRRFEGMPETDVKKVPVSFKKANEVILDAMSCKNMI